MSKHSFHLRGYIMIFIAAVLFGSYGVWSKIIGSDFGIYYQGWVRSAIVLIILLPLVYFTKAYKRVERKDWKWFSVPVIFGVFTQAPLYYAYINADIGTSTLIFYSMFVITSYLVGWLLLKEQMSKLKIAAMVLSFIGLAFVFGFSIERFTVLALLMAALNGIASGGEVATTKKPTQKYSSLMVSIAVWIGILITHLPASLIAGETQWAPVVSEVWLAMFGFAVAGLLAFWLVVEGFKHVDASIGSLIGLFEIIFGIIYGAILFGEQLTTTVIIGAGIILVAAMLPDITEIISRKRKRSTS